MNTEPITRALTLRPHWAHAVAWHGKRIENRGTPIPRALVGHRVAIHAGRFVAGHWWDDVRAASGGTVPRGVTPVPLTRGKIYYQGPWEQAAKQMQCRAIVATAVLSYATPPGWDPQACAYRWADPEAGSWWTLGDVQVLATALPMRRGQLGLWRLDSATARALTDAPLTLLEAS